MPWHRPSSSALINTEPAKAAARTAGRLAQALGAELVVVTAYGKYEFEALDSTAEDIYVSTPDLALAVADEAVAELKSTYPEVIVTSVAAAGKPGEALITVADRHDADVIVIGNKGVHGIARVFGSIAATSPRTRRATSMSSTRSRAAETRQGSKAYRWPSARPKAQRHSLPATPCRDGKVASAIRGSSAGRSPGARASLHRPDRGRCPRSPSRCQCAAARSSVQPRGSRRGTGPDVLRRAQPQ